jgi:hypothetical protein
MGGATVAAMTTPSCDDMTTSSTWGELRRALAQLASARAQTAAAHQVLDLLGASDAAARTAVAYELAVCAAVERLAGHRVEALRREESRRAA